MDLTTFQPFLNWITAHPNWAGLAVFIISFSESLVVVGLFVPGVAMMFGIGTLVAMGALNLWVTLAWAAAGAVAGDSLSYWLGHHYQDRLRDVWPIRRYPGLMNRGEQFFQRHGGKSVLFGRFVGPVRPIIPTVAGMLGMPPSRFIMVNVLSAIAWAPAYTLPGVVFGASLGLASEIASRLTVLVLVVLVILWLSVQTTRGCPHSCSFCSVTAFFHNRYRIRPIDRVIRDVQAARRHGSRYIAFIDDNMVGDLDYSARLWEALIPQRIIWMTQCSLKLAENPSLLKLAYRSGCRLVSIGIESIDSSSLNSVGKGWNQPERYEDSIAAFRDNGIEVSTEMIVGFDHDDISALERTLRFIQANRIAVPRVHILTPIPGTPLFRELEEAGRITRRNFDSYTGSKAVFRPAHIDPSALERGYWEMYEKLFSWRSIFRRLYPSETSLGPYMRAVIWAANVRYRRHVKARISPGIL